MMITASMKDDKKEKAAQAIARAKAWAEKRRNPKVDSSSGRRWDNLQQQQQQQQQRDVQKVAILKEMLMKESKVLVETKMRMKLIEAELKKYE